MGKHSMALDQSLGILFCELTVFMELDQYHMKSCQRHRIFLDHVFDTIY